MDISINEKNAKYKVKFRHYECPLAITESLPISQVRTWVYICVMYATPLASVDVKDASSICTFNEQM